MEYLLCSSPPVSHFRQWPRSCELKGQGEAMLHWSLIFLVIAIIAGILGFGGIAGAAVGLAKILFFLFLVIWLLAFFIGRRAV
jgi:uncharacterized membrane protein YtjA (UPF0391 family)